MGQGRSRAKSEGSDESDSSKDELAKQLMRPLNRQFGIHDAKLVEIPEIIFEWTDLEVLRLDVNLIRCIPSTIALLAQLTELTLSSNRLTSLLPPLSDMVDHRETNREGEENGKNGDVDSTTSRMGGRGIFDLTSLHKLNLNSNQIESLPEDLTRLVNLTHLNLSANRLQSLPSLRGLTQLSVLVVTINRLTSLPPLPSSLVVLAAGRNDLRRFEPVVICEDDDDAAAEKNEDEQRTFTKAKQSESDKKRSDKKQSKKKSAKKSKEKDEEVAATEDEKAESWFARLQELDLSENKLTEFPPALLQMSSLTALQLACNYIAAFPPPGFARAWPRLRSLRVGFNELTDLPAEVLELPALQRFDFLGNPFQLDQQVAALARKRAERALEEKERKRKAAAEEEERKRRDKKTKKEKNKSKNKKNEDDVLAKLEQKDLKLALDGVVQRRDGESSDEEEEEATRSSPELDEKGDEAKAGWMVIRDEFTKRGDWDYNSIGTVVCVVCRVSCVSCVSCAVCCVSRVSCAMRMSCVSCFRAEADECNSVRRRHYAAGRDIARAVPGFVGGRRQQAPPAAPGRHAHPHRRLPADARLRRRASPTCRAAAAASAAAAARSSELIYRFSRCFPVFQRFTYKHVEIDDLHTENVMEHFESCIEFIDQARQAQSNVLVHWFALQLFTRRTRTAQTAHAHAQTAHAHAHARAGLRCWWGGAVVRACRGVRVW
jgi:Leucine-rich repeat (LRR) protein